MRPRVIKWERKSEFVVNFVVSDSNAHRSPKIYPYYLRTLWIMQANNRESECRTYNLNGGYIRHMKQEVRMQEIRAGREVIQRANLCHEEFLALIALMFWVFGWFQHIHFINLSLIRAMHLSIVFCKKKLKFLIVSSKKGVAVRRVSDWFSFLGDSPVGDEMTQLGERYRESIMKELHAFYREHLRLDDYATRLGELMLLLPVFDVSTGFSYFRNIMFLDWNWEYFKSAADLSLGALKWYQPILESDNIPSI